jgi:hypothetical protein
MKRKLTTHHHEQQEQLSSQQTHSQHTREFATAEEMLRHDALHTPVPPSIAARLQESLGQTAAATPWWRRLFPK